MKIKNNLKNKHICKILCEINKLWFCMISCFNNNSTLDESEKDPIRISSEKQINKSFFKS